MTTRKMATQRNARLWIFPNGSPVKVTLRPGDSIAWGRSYHHEEGWSREGIELTYDGETVEREVWEDGTDCDGRTSSSEQSFCHRSRLQARCGEWDGEPYPMPEWEWGECQQRDYTAEAAGY